MPNQSNKFLIFWAILIAGGLITWGIWATGGEQTSNPKNLTETSSETSSIEEPTSFQTKLISLEENDYILGNPTANIIFISFTDFDCGFCKVFHQTLHQIIEDYGKSGQVAWVSRQFPIHGAISEKKAKAARCAGLLGGNNQFWEMTDKIFQTDFSENENFTEEQLLDLATTLKINKADFSQCLASKEVAKEIKQDYQSGITVGVLGENNNQGGTPYTIILTRNNNRTYPIRGAQPYQIVKSITDLILQEQ